MISHLELVQSCGRISVHLTGRRMGEDLLIAIWGGQAHVGAIALATPRMKTRMLQCPGHRDGEIAMTAARIIARGANCHVAVACGIHYDYITPEEIATVRQLARILAESLLAKITRARRAMLNMTDLEDFEQKLQSGAIDEAFKCANDQERGNILELLEKIMDVADLANEVATRLIFRGRMQ